MMANTLREHFKNEYPNGTDTDEHEKIYWTIKEWVANHGMEFSADDRLFLDEIGEDTSYYMEFDEEQENRIGEIYELTHELCELLITPLPGRTDDLQVLVPSHYLEIADHIADLLSRAGYTVFFPVHVECPDGTEYVSDIYNDPKGEAHEF